MNEGRLLIALLLVVAIVLYAPYMRAVATCRELQRTSQNLVRSPQCSDDLLLRRYGPAQQKLCDRAHTDLHVSPWMCAIETVWYSAELYVMLSEAMRSHWLLFGFMAVSVVTLGWVLMRTCTHNAEARAVDRLADRLQSLSYEPRREEVGGGMKLIRRH